MIKNLDSQKNAPEKKRRAIIGWREWVSLPGLEVGPIKVKVDSGARSCALHATRIRYSTDTDGVRWVTFSIIADPEKKISKRVRVRLLDKRKVKSSLGHATLRPVIETEIQLGNEVWLTEVTLVNRDPMGFRMLLGRRALRGRFLIHPGRSFVLSKNQGLPTE